MKSNKKILSLVISGLLTVLPSQNAAAQEAVIDPGLIAQIVDAVSGYVEQKVQTLLGGQGNSTSIGAETEAEKNIAQYKTQVAHDLEVDILNAKARINALDMYGPTATLQGCAPGQEGADLYAGDASARALVSSGSGIPSRPGKGSGWGGGVVAPTYDGTIGRNHAFKDSAEIMADLSDANFVKKDEITILAVKPDNYILKTQADVDKAKKLFDRAINNAPPLNLSNEAIEENSLAGKKYKEIRKIYDAKALLPIMISNKYWADMVGSIKYDGGGWAGELWAQMQQGGTYPGLNDQSLMSPMSALNLDVMARYENKAFYEIIKNEGNSVLLHRHLNLIMATRNRIKFETMQYYTAMTTMQSQNQMDHLNETLGRTLESLRVDAHKNTAIK